MRDRQSLATIAGISVAAMCLATFFHEAAGHGSACILAGGRITKLTSVYFDCAPMTGAVALGGPLGNIAAALLGWGALRLLPNAMTRPRLGALLLMALSIFWAAGYLIYAMLRKNGDYALAAHELLPISPFLWQPGGIALGIVLYAVATRIVVREAARLMGANARGVLPMAWVFATASALAAAALYRDAPLAAMLQAGLEIGAASFPLLYLGRRCAGPAITICGSIPWMVAGATLFGVFALSLGRGLAWLPSALGQ